MRFPGAHSLDVVRIASRRANLVVMSTYLHVAVDNDYNEEEGVADLLGPKQANLPPSFRVRRH
jgi:hypothetical protein